MVAFRDTDFIWNLMINIFVGIWDNLSGIIEGIWMLVQFVFYDMWVLLADMLDWIKACPERSRELPSSSQVPEKGDDNEYI